LLVAVPPSARALRLLTDELQVVRVDVAKHVHRADRLRGIVAEDTLEGGVGVEQGTVEIDYLHDLHAVLHDRAQPPNVVPGGLVCMRGPVDAPVDTVLLYFRI
jgi:hypothetical protein